MIQKVAWLYYKGSLWDLDSDSQNGESSFYKLWLEIRLFPNDPGLVLVNIKLHARGVGV